MLAAASAEIDDFAGDIPLSSDPGRKPQERAHP